MNLKFLPIMFMSLLLIVACKSDVKKTNLRERGKQINDKSKSTTHDHAKKEWSYVGESNPEYWKELEGDSACGGNAQSPINIITSEVVKGDSGLKPSDIHYQSETLVTKVINNGHTIEYVFEGAKNYVTYQGTRYDLAQFHFHAMSEHTINGIHYPLVKHMVHTSKEKGYLVLAVLFEEKSTENKTFDFLESYLPINIGSEKEIGKSFDFTDQIPTKFEHYSYTGSLTTPPCTEGVHWIIFTESEKISEEQVSILAKLMPVNNYRPSQKLNNRIVTISQ